MFSMSRRFLGGWLVWLILFSLVVEVAVLGAFAVAGAEEPDDVSVGRFNDGYTVLMNVDQGHYWFVAELDNPGACYGLVTHLQTREGTWTSLADAPLWVEVSPVV